MKLRTVFKLSSLFLILLILYSCSGMFLTEDRVKELSAQVYQEKFGKIEKSLKEATQTFVEDLNKNIVPEIKKQVSDYAIKNLVPLFTQKLLDELYDVKTRIASLEKNLDKLNEQIKTTSSYSENLKKEIDVLKTDIEQLKVSLKSLEKLSQDLNNISTDLNSQKVKIQDLEKEYADLQKKLISSEKRMEITKKQLEENLKHYVDNKTAEIDKKLLTAQSSITVLSANLSTRLKNFDSKLENLSKTFDIKIQNSLSTFSSSLSVLEKKLDENYLYINNFKKSLTASLTYLDESIQKLFEESNYIENTLSEFNNKIGEIENLQNEFSNRFISLNSSITNLEELLNKDFLKYSEFKNFKTELDFSLMKIREKGIQNENEINYIRKTLNNINGIIESQKSTMVSFESKLQELQNNFKQFSLSFENLKNEYSQNLKSINLKVNDLNSKLNNINQKIENLDLSHIENQVKAISQEIEKKFEEIENIKKLNEEVDNLKESMKVLENTVESLKSQIIDEKQLQEKLIPSLEDTVKNRIMKDYYRERSEELKKIEELSERLKNIEGKISKVEKTIEVISSRPPDTIDERILTKLQRIEKLLYGIMASFSDESIKEIFGNSEEIVYKVKQGDTLSEIAMAFGLGLEGVDIIMRANNISDPKKLRAGQKIIIPVKNIEKYLRWPLEKTKPTYFERIVIKFGDKTLAGVSTGIGISALYNEKIYAALPGRIIETGKLPGGTYYVKIDHGNGIVTVYMRLAKIFVKTGKWVDTRSPIGEVNKGKIFIFELWKNGEPKDPLRLFFKDLGEYKATFYTEWDDKLIYHPSFRLTKAAKIPKDWRTIAADLKNLPLGTVVYIPAFSNTSGRGFFIVEDTGKKVKGNWIDIYVRDVRSAMKSEKVKVYLVGKR